MAEPEDDNPFAKYLTDDPVETGIGGGGAPPMPKPSDDDNPFTKYVQEAPGVLESFLRGNVEGGTFGYEDKLGFSKEAREASKKANPWTHFMGEMTGTIAPMVAATLLPTGVGQAAAGSRLANLGTRALGAVRSAMVPAPVSTVGQSMLQGSKVAGVYAGLSGTGHADVKDDDTWAEALQERGVEGLKHGAVGTVLGAPLGAAGYGLSKLIGASLNRAMPELNEVLAAANNPELQGIRDIVRQAGYDKYTMADFAALRDALRDPARRHIYEGLNLIEALETKPLMAMPNTGELKPPVVVSPNLRSTAQDYANIEGVGRTEAREAFASRKNEMAARIQADVDRLFGQDPDGIASALSTTFNRNIPGKATEIEAIPGLVDRAFGSGSPEAAEAALVARGEMFNKRYDRLRSGPLKEVGPEITRVAQTVPEIQQALNYAARNDMLRLAEIGAEWTQPWSKGQIGFNIQTLSPANILDMHHFFSVAAKPPITGATPETVMMGRWKNWFSDWVDSKLSKHEGLREEYTLFKRAMEAPDQANKLGLFAKSDRHPAMQWFDKARRDYESAVRTVANEQGKYDRAMARYNAGSRTSQPARTDLNRAREIVQGHEEVLAAYRRAWGENLKDAFAHAKTPEQAAQLVKEALTPAGQARIMKLAGPQEGPRLINEFLIMEARNQGMSLGIKSGGSDHAALQFFDRAVREGRDDVVAAFRQAWGEKFKQEIRALNDPNRVIRDAITEEGKRRILKILGPEDGKTFIEALYNKYQQMGLSQTLYGGPDTAYKMARQKKLQSFSDAVSGLIPTPWTWSPSQSWRGLRELASAGFTQRRADQGNRLLSKQGPEAVTELVDGILAQTQLAQTGPKYVLGPALKGLGPAAATIPNQQTPWENRPRPMPPYKP